MRQEFVFLHAGKESKAMIVRAKQRLFYSNNPYMHGEAQQIKVASNPLGALHLTDSIKVYLHDTYTKKWFHTAISYETITDFLADWKIIKARTHTVRVPFLRRVIGGGDAFAFFAEKMPLWFKMKFNGCLDRREWWNHWIHFVPLKRENALVSQVVFDSVMDIRRALRDRGENPHDYTSPPLCDVCGMWVGTHVIGEIIVCDKARCQDRVTHYYTEHGYSLQDGGVSYAD